MYGIVFMGKWILSLKMILYFVLLFYYDKGKNVFYYIIVWFKCLCDVWWKIGFVLIYSNIVEFYLVYLIIGFF